MARIRYFVGIDEVGRGPVAGPLCVAACATAVRLYPRTFFIRGVNPQVNSSSRTSITIRDSKQLSHKNRLALAMRIREAKAKGRLFVAATFVGERTIDSRGISFSLKTAISRVLRRLGFPPAQCLIRLDGGIKAPRTFAFQKTIVRGDETEPLIALASIVAKVHRDKRMIRLAQKFPEYEFEKHKGYGTRRHFEALYRYGPCAIHRKSFLKKLIAYSSQLNNRFLLLFWPFSYSVISYSVWML